MLNIFRIFTYKTIIMSKFHKADIVIVYKNSKRANAKLRMKIYKNRFIDDILESKLIGIPPRAELLHIGVGALFEAKWRKKYNL